MKFPPECHYITGKSKRLPIDPPFLGKRAPEEESPEEQPPRKCQKTDSSIRIEIDSLQRFEFAPETVPLKCHEKLKIVELEPQKKASVGISASRSKREVKKNTPYDNSEYIIDNDEPLENPGSTPHTSRKRQQSQATTAPQKGVQSLKFQKINDSQDPFQLFFKQIMEPILQLDRLEVLSQDKLEYEICIKAKDLKSHSVKPERKEEMLTQRIYLD
jgi:hypothetical protein